MRIAAKPCVVAASTAQFAAFCVAADRCRNSAPSSSGWSRWWREVRFIQKAQLKRFRRTNRQLEVLREAIYEALQEDHPMTVRQVFSPERLLDQTALFLHCNVAEMPVAKRRLLEELHHSDKVLPGKKAARFYQIENKMDAVIRYDLASEIPVVEQ